MAKAPWEDYQQSSNEEDGPWTDFAPAKSTQASVPEAYIGEDGRRYIKSVDKPSTPTFGDLFTKEVDDFFGTAEAAANLVTGGIAQGTGLIGGGAEYLRKKFAGEPTTFEKEYADSMQRQTFEPRGESGQEKAAAIGKFFNDVGIPLAGHGAVGPTLASGKPVAQTKKPPTANKTVEAIRAAQEAKKAETVAGEDPAVIELAKQRAAEMQAKAQARPITVDSSGNAALDATKGPFVREDPMTRMVRELGGEPLPKETVTPDNAITRMAEDLTSEKTPESVWKAQEELDARQRALEEGVVAARKQDEAITDVSHRRMGPEDTTPSTGQFSLENFKKGSIARRQGLRRRQGFRRRQGGYIHPDLLGVGAINKAIDFVRDNFNKDSVRALLAKFDGTYNPKTMLSDIKHVVNNPGSRLVMMSPDTFHELASDRPGEWQKVFKSDSLRKRVTNGVESRFGLDDIPYLTLDANGKVLAHEGRHRMDVFKKKQLDAVPVLLVNESVRLREPIYSGNILTGQGKKTTTGRVELDLINDQNRHEFSDIRPTNERTLSGELTSDVYHKYNQKYGRGDPYNVKTNDQNQPIRKSGLGKKQGGAINLFDEGGGITYLRSGFTPEDLTRGLIKLGLWEVPTADSIVGRISRAFKEEGVDLIDQNLIPPNPELQSVIDTAKAEGPKGDGKFLKNLQSGSTSVAMKTRSPLLLAGSRIGQNALKMTDIHVRNYVMPAENAIRKLSKDDIQTLHEVMLEESRNREMFDKDVLAEHLNPDQLIAYDLIRKMQENQLEQVNAARKEKGLEPVDAHEAYLASRWQGDFRRPIYQKVGENGKKLVWYLASNTKMGLARETKNLLKYAEENGIKDLVVDESLDHQVHTSRNRTDLETTYSTMIDLLGRDDPAVKAMAELVEQAKAAEAYNAFGAKKHFEEKAGIRGFVGDRPWRDPKKEAVTAFEEQFQQSKNAYSWAFTQKAVDGITKLASDPDLVKMQPKNVAFLRDYAKTLMGMSETKLAKALDDSFRSTGISPKLIQQGVGNLKSYFILTKLGASVGNMVVNTLQTANIPSYLSQMVGAGYRGNPITSIATGMFGGIMMATAHYTPKTSRAMIPDGFLREAVDYAEANGVTARSIVDEAPVGSSKTITGKAVRAIGHTLSGPETLARSVAFMSYAKMLESSGKFTKEQWPQMFQLAEEYTNKSMVDYRQTEHAMIYGKGGTIGKALNVLQTYPMSFWNQYSFMAREAAKGNPWGLLTMLPTHYLLAGVAGIPAAEALDKLYKLVKDNLLSTETWAELNESPFWRDPKAWLIDQMGQGYYGKLSVDTGINWTSRLGAPGPESMVMAPGGAAVELAQQGMAVGKALMDPTNSTKWAQAGMKTVPVALQGLLEQSGAMKDHTYVIKPKTGERVYQKNTDLAAREGQYIRSPEEEKIRNFGLRSQKEVMTRDMMYSASREVKLGQQKAAELPDRIYDAARRGDQQKANTLAALYMSISKDQNAGATLEEALKRAEQAEYTTTEKKAALGIKESVNKAIAYARARKALESVK